MEKKIPEKGLVIGPPWAGRIMSGDKSWELRKRATKIRGEIGIIAKGTGTIIGTVELVDCLGPLDQKTLVKNRHLSCETKAEILQDVEEGYVYAWVLDNPVIFEKPVPYKHPSGAVTWVNLPPCVEQNNNPLVTVTDSLTEDFERVGDKLSTQTRGKGGPEYNPLSRTFTAVAQTTGDLLGEAVVTQNWGKLEVDLMYVKSKHRHKGVGTSLMHAVEAFARAQNLRAIRLNTPTWQGTGFYERLGYQEMGRIPIDADVKGQPQSEVTYFKILRTF